MSLSKSVKSVQEALPGLWTNFGHDFHNLLTFFGLRSFRPALPGPVLNDRKPNKAKILQNLCPKLVQTPVSKIGS